MNEPIPSDSEPLALISIKLHKDDNIEIIVRADEGQVIDMFVNFFKHDPELYQIIDKARTMYLSHINPKKN
jgi:hypothetical protein